VKGIQSTQNSHLIYNFLSYHYISPSYFSFISSLSSIIVPKNVQKALDHLGWRQTMIVKMQALEKSGTWELVSFPLGKKTVADGFVLLKSRLMVRLINLRLGWLPKTTLRFMALIIMTPSLL